MGERIMARRLVIIAEVVGKPKPKFAGFQESFEGSRVVKRYYTSEELAYMDIPGPNRKARIALSDPVKLGHPKRIKREPRVAFNPNMVVTADLRKGGTKC
jgi:hypothetical protein